MNVFTLPNPRPLEKRIAKKIDAAFAKNTAWRQFTGGEWHLRVVKKSTRALVIGRAEPTGDHLIQTFTLLDTVRQNGTKSITLVLPYFGYSRQDRGVRSGDHLPADLFLNLFKACGANRIVVTDLHSPITQERSPLPLITVDIAHEFAPELALELSHGPLFTVVAPDLGARQRADHLRDLLDKHAPVCWLKKTRDPKTGRVCGSELFGVKRGTTAVIIDDILDTGGTIKECVMRLKKGGVKTFYLAVTHPLFSANAVKTIRALRFKKIFVSNTIPLSPECKRTLPVEVVDAAPALIRALTSRE